MRRIIVGLLAGGLLSGMPAGACGDKLLITGRGVRFQGGLAMRPASVLAYVHPGVRSSAAMNDPAFQAALKKAGHKLSIVENEQELREALNSGKYDLLLVDVSDASTFGDFARTVPVSLVVLPVVFEGTKVEIREAEKQYQCVMKAPSKGGGYLSAIEKAMELKVKRAKAKAQQKS
jgi:hypothetical protein